MNTTNTTRYERYKRHERSKRYERYERFNASCRTLWDNHPRRPNQTAQSV